jgi:hypothetical protein
MKRSNSLSKVRMADEENVDQEDGADADTQMENGELDIGDDGKFETEGEGEGDENELESSDVKERVTDSTTDFVSAQR